MSSHYGPPAAVAVVTQVVHNATPAPLPGRGGDVTRATVDRGPRWQPLSKFCRKVAGYLFSRIMPNTDCPLRPAPVVSASQQRVRSMKTTMNAFRAVTCK